MEMANFIAIITVCFIITVSCESLYPNLETDLASTPPTSSPIHRRHKRYIAFPEGSSLSVAVCMTVGIYGNPMYNFVSWAVNWGVAYNLPNATWLQTSNFQLLDLLVEPPAAKARRFRKDLYGKLEKVMDSIGFNGRECILHALCESAQVFRNGNYSMVHELLRTVLTLPRSKVMSFEHSDLHQYDFAHRKGRSLQINCDKLYSKCGFSLIEMVLGW